MQRARLPAAFESEPEISRSVLRAQRIFKALRLWDNALDREAERMVIRRLGLLLALFFGFLASCLAAQGGANENIFTISVAAPASPKDVQVRYFLTGDFGVYSSSTTARDVGNKIAIRSVDEAKSPRTLKAIVYAPGCQFVTISVEELTAGSREGEFQCQKLPTTQFRGRFPISGLEGKNLQVEVLYACRWARQFFNIFQGAVSPFSLSKTAVEADGSFTIELPDFAQDPLWPSLSNDAALMFFVVDAGSGQRLTTLKLPGDLPSAGFLRVATSYPAEVEFTAQPGQAKR